ncbi:PREDICTED: uncharacterized protein LOC109339605 [Lupinus angustifolius]|uniref:uncharacterized protein LOC109339605 n=1 Tax=Lupinus angustifolius TaxID=3871 RepID=UPI00092FCA02|nr:PREDICTED: uncharacterized protein LOC109339605 [Lupinus angustifolius]
MKEMELQTMRRKYELLQMEENETISDYFTKILTLRNKMKSCGEEVKEQSMIEKILRTLTPKYDHIVVAIEESKELEDYKLEELQNSLESREQWNKNKKKENEAIECKSKRVLGRKDEEASLAQNGGSDDDEHYLLMANVKSSEESGDFWYLYIGRSNHMTCKKDWFTTLDESTKSKVMFDDHNAISAEGIGKVMIQRRDGKKAYISKVPYVLKMKGNLLSLGQLLENGYIMEMKDGMMKVFDKTSTTS